MRIGLSEIIIITFLIIALLNPDKLRDYLKAFKSASASINEAKEELNGAINDIKEPIEEIREDINNAQSKLFNEGEKNETEKHRK